MNNPKDKKIKQGVKLQDKKEIGASSRHLASIEEVGIDEEIVSHNQIDMSIAPHTMNSKNQNNFFLQQKISTGLSSD